MHKWEQKVEVYESDSINDEKDVSDLFPQITTGIAQHVTEFDKEFSQKKQYRMTFENAKGKVKENLINIKRIKTDEQAVEHAEDLIKTWRGDKADSNINQSIRVWKLQFQTRIDWLMVKLKLVNLNC